MDIYDSHEIQKYEAEDFYDDEILDRVYADVRSR